MRQSISAVRGYLAELWQVWNRFWFTPTDPATLSLLRLLVGGMLLYTHAIWSLDLTGFIGPDGYLPVDYLRGGGAMPWTKWSIFFWIKPIWLLWTVHVLALVIFACMMLGLFSRTTTVLAYLLAVSYANRVTPGAFFGLDKANLMSAMYLTLGPTGARYSFDRLWKLRKGRDANPLPSVSANLAIRLLQVHLCIVYLFSGTAKMTGASWRGGSAVWWAVASYEYQSIDLTWLAGYPLLVALLTHATVFWEVYYCCLVWNRFTRPVVLWMAVAIHGGIALFLGMITFGLSMIFANLAFLQPATVRSWIDPLASRVSLALVGRRVG